MGDSALGSVMRALREKRGLSLRDLGTLAETDHAYIAKIERGDKEAPPGRDVRPVGTPSKPSPHKMVYAEVLLRGAEHGPIPRCLCAGRSGCNARAASDSRIHYASRERASAAGRTPPNAQSARSKSWRE